MLDKRDRRILMLLQQDAEMPVAEIAEQVALSPSACSRRIARLRTEGYISSVVALLDRRKLNLPTTIFLMVRTSQHGENWLSRFHAALNEIPEIVEVHRLTGTFDYIAKLVLPDVESYDRIYKRLIGAIELHDMSAHISMETVKLATALPIRQC